jgi:NADH-quinone oxidoreductase subunit L
MYTLAWVIVALPLAGAGFSFVAESPRRAGQVCMTFVAGSLLLALIVLGYRFAHLTTSVTPNVSAIDFFSISPNTTETSFYSSTMSADAGVWVDNLSTGFMALTGFVVLVVQGLATAMLRGDPGYRRFFWLTSFLGGAMLGMIAAPSLFQAWMALGAMTIASLALSVHRWHRDETAAPAWRSFLALLGADTILLLGLAVAVYKLGATMGLETAPGGFTQAPYFDYRVLDTAWQQLATGKVPLAGYRTMWILCLLLVVPALIRSAQLPFTAWLTGLREAPLPVLAAMAGSLLTGVILIARLYPLLLDTRHALSALALVGAVGALLLAIAFLVSSDIYCLALLSAAAQMALAVTAMGAGGYSLGLLIAFVSAPVDLLLLAVAGSIARAYRTRDIQLMGGAWERMRRSSASLILWAVLAAGLDLVGYDVLSTVLTNRLPNGGHLAGAVQGAVLGLAVATMVVIALGAGRLVTTVCAGRPAARRSGVVERIAEAEPRLRAIQAWSGGAAVVAVLAGLPGVTTIVNGKSRFPGLTFSHWVFYGSARQALPVQPAALLLAAAALVGGLVAGALVARVGWARLGLARLSPEPLLAWAARPATWLASALGGTVQGADQDLVAPLYDAAGEGMETVAWSLGRAPGRRLRLGVAAALAVVLALVGLSVLAAGGHLPVHTT